MRKNIKNDKVLRAITIGLATMIAATSAPVTVLADDDTDPVEDTNKETEQGATTNDEKAAEHIEKAENIITGEPTAEPLVQSDDNQNVPAEETGVPEVVDAPVTADQISDQEAAVKGCVPAINEALKSTASTDENGKVNTVYGMNVSMVTTKDENGIITAQEAQEGENGQSVIDDLNGAKALLQQQVVIGEDGNPAVDENGNIVKTDLGALEYLQDAKDVLDGKVKNDEGKSLVDIKKNIENYANAGDSAVAAAKENADNFEKHDGETTGSANDVISDAAVANSSDNKEEAYAAKDSAFDNLGKSESGLKAAQEDLNNINADIDQTQADLDLIDAELASAQGFLNRINEDVKKGKENANATAAKLKDAQAKVEYYKELAKANQEKLDELKKIKEQSYAMMVLYCYQEVITYETVKDENNKTVNKLDENGNKIEIKDQTFRNLECAEFNEDGSLNIEKTAENLRKSTGQINTIAEKGTSKLTQIGRYLTSLLTKYLIENDEGIDLDLEDYEFVFGADLGQYIKPDGAEAEKNNKKEYWEKCAPGNAYIQSGVVYKEYKNPYNHDEGIRDNTNVNGNPKNKVDTKVAKGERTDNVQWYSARGTASGKGGRNNFVVVKYKDANGEPKTRRFNYVYKNSKYGDELDLENGVFSLCEIMEDGSVEKITSPNNMDNYTKLSNLISAIDTYNANGYQNIQKELTNAQKEVDRLQKELDAIGTVILNKERKQKLEEKLQEAIAKRNELNQKVENLEKKVQEARDAYNGIKLSRFDEKEPAVPGPATPAPATPVPEVTADDADDDGTSGSTSEGTTGGTYEGPAIGTYTGATDFGAPAGYTGTFDEVADGTGEGGAATGVLGVRKDNGTGNGTGTGNGNGGNTLKNIDPAKKILVANNTRKDVINKALKKITDPEVPLADIPGEDNVEMSWWWLVLIFLLGALGKKMYDDYRKKAEEAEAANKVNK
ncbi:MAG: hypothetical protein K5739_11850 [Lachnospiraceae bacterium]|nr:hypothetical protein [Lachnospiraceae bacterium]